MTVFVVCWRRPAARTGSPCSPPAVPLPPLLQLIVGVPPLKAFELNWQIVNTSLTRLKFRGEEVSLASFNSHVHLELLKAPELITYR
ncbi:phosphoglycerate mutase [Pseudomonas aeruginosa]|nr:phosphoglycerate mutase [Pseudomonas aeruginosa]